MFETLKTIITILGEKEVPKVPDKIVVSLEELSTLWIKYNNSFEPVVPKPALSIPSATVIDAEKEVPSVEIATSAFYDEVIEPYRALLERDKTLEGINAMVNILKEDGGCPSIVQVGYDSETEEVPRIEEILSHVSVRDHTFRTTRIAMKLLNDRYGEKPVAYVSVMLIAALGHDLGKIPRFRREGRYVKADHPVTSAGLVEGLFPELSGTHTLSVALTAIKEHHHMTKDQVCMMLKEADGRAREIEIAAGDKGGAVLPVAEWFDPLEYMERIGRQVNVTQTGNPWQAFSFGDTIYFEPGFLYDSAREMALEKNVINIEFLRQSDRDAALLKILKVLRPLNVLGDELGVGYVTRRYEVQTALMKKKASFTPFKASAFDDREFEERKKDHPPMIMGIKSF